jgi:CheY-like chemotaxis protein
MGLFDLFKRKPSRPSAYQLSGPIFVIADLSAAALVPVLGALRPVKTSASAASDLLDQIAAAEPAIIVIEAEQAGMNGFLVVKGIKSDERLRAIPCVVFSDMATEETFEQHKKLRTRAEAYVMGCEPAEIARVVAARL